MKRKLDAAETRKAQIGEVLKVLEGSKLAGAVHTDQESFDARLKQGKGIEQWLTDTDEVWGFTDGNEIWLNPKTARLETPIHEYGHLGISMCKKVNRAVYDRGIALAKEIGLFKEISENEAYKSSSEESRAEEVLATIIGKRGEEALKGAPETLRAKVKEWLVDFWKAFGEALGLKDITPEQAAKMTLEEVADAIRAEMMSGKRFGEKAESRQAERSSAINTGGMRFSVEIRQVESAKVENLIKEIVEGKVKRKTGNSLAIRERTGEEGRIQIEAAKVFKTVKDERMALPNGGELYFAPDKRAVEAYDGDMAKAWAEYCIHLVTHGVTKAETGERYRTFNESTIEKVLPEIKQIVDADSVKVDPKRRQVIFYRQSEDAASKSKSRYQQVVAEIDENGDVRVDLRYITGILKSGRIPGQLTTLRDALPTGHAKGITAAVESTSKPAHEGEKPFSHAADDVSKKLGKDKNSLNSNTPRIVSQKGGGKQEAERSSAVSAEMDAEYLDAVKRGDMETAQRIVYEAASRAMANTKIIGENGLPLVMYHGTNNDFTTFSAEKMRPGAYGDGFYFATTPERARLYGDRIIPVFLNAKADNRDAKRLGVEKDYIRTSAGDVIVKNPEQIKLADPVTYDDAGNVIPLSQRFNPQSNDIRFSIGGIFTGSAADYANRSREGGKDDGPSLLKIGSGEGAQVYGWGLYGSNRRGVAEGYARQDVSKKARISYDLTIDGEKVDFDDKFKWSKSKRIALMAVRGAGSIESALSELKYRHEQYTYGDGTAAEHAIKWLEKNKDKIGGITREHLYEQTFFTDRAPGDESHLLKWYEPVSEEMQNRLLESAVKEGKASKSGKYFFIGENTMFESGTRQTGEELYLLFRDMLGSPKAASEWLAAHDIDGVKYPVDSYGGKTVKDGDEAGWNYVSFRDDNIRVDHKWTNGELKFSVKMIGTDEGVYKTSIDTKNPKTKDGRNTVIFRRDPRECDALLVESETIKAVEKALPENIKTGDKSIKYTESERIAVRNFVKEKAKAQRGEVQNPEFGEIYIGLDFVKEVQAHAISTAREIAAVSSAREIAAKMRHFAASPNEEIKKGKNKYIEYGLATFEFQGERYLVMGEVGIRNNAKPYYDQRIVAKIKAETSPSLHAHIETESAFDEVYDNRFRILMQAAQEAENKVAALGLEEGTTSTLRTLKSRDNVITPEGLMSRIVSQNGSGKQEAENNREVMMQVRRQELPTVDGEDVASWLLNGRLRLADDAKYGAAAAERSPEWATKSSRVVTPSGDTRIIQPMSFTMSMLVDLYQSLRSNPALPKVLQKLNRENKNYLARITKGSVF